MSSDWFPYPEDMCRYMCMHNNNRIHRLSTHHLPPAFHTTVAVACVTRLCVRARKIAPIFPIKWLSDRKLFCHGFVNSMHHLNTHQPFFPFLLPPSSQQPTIHRIVHVVVAAMTGAHFYFLKFFSYFPPLNLLLCIRLLWSPQWARAFASTFHLFPFLFWSWFLFACSAWLSLLVGFARRGLFSVASYHPCHTFKHWKHWILNPPLPCPPFELSYDHFITALTLFYRFAMLAFLFAAPRNSFIFPLQKHTHTYQLRSFILFALTLLHFPSFILLHNNNSSNPLLQDLHTVLVDVYFFRIFYSSFFSILFLHAFGPLVYFHFIYIFLLRFNFCC